MNQGTTLTLCALALVCMTSSIAMAQNAPPTYQGDPDVYKVIFEDQNFRVIEAIRKKTSRTAIQFRRSYITSAIAAQSCMHQTGQPGKTTARLEPQMRCRSSVRTPQKTLDQQIADKSSLSANRSSESAAAAAPLVRGRLREGGGHEST